MGGVRKGYGGREIEVGRWEKGRRGGRELEVGRWEKGRREGES